MARRKSTTGKSMVAWEKEMEKEAAAAVEALPVSGGNFISTRGGKMTLNGNPFPDNILECVILQSVLENSFYEGKFDPNNPSSPACYAFSVPDARDPSKGMSPHEQSEDPQSQMCAGCEMNEWGTADVGRGKACKNIVRLALLPSDCLDSPEDIEEAQLAFIKVPVTSVKAFSSHVRTVAERFKRPPYGVITEVSLTPDPDSQFKMGFTTKPSSVIKKPNILEALKAKKEQANKEIVLPYPKFDEEDSGKGKGRGKTSRSRVAKKTTKKKVGRKRTSRNV